MSTAAAIAQSIADRVLDEDAAIDLVSTPPDLAGTLLADLARAAASDGIDPDEAASWARKGADRARLDWLDSPAGRAAVETAVRATERDREVMRHGLLSSQVRTVERVTRATVAQRLAERDPTRAAADNTGPPDAARADGAPAGRATST